MFHALKCLKGEIIGSFLVLENGNKILISKSSRELFEQKSSGFFLVVQNCVLGRIDEDFKK